jgi:hypothetical protein
LSHLIATTALIILIFTVQVFYLYVVDNIWAEMSKRELKEVTDYVADTLANLYFLVNSTNIDIALNKTLNLPSEVGGLSYSLEIDYQNQTANGITGAFLSKPWLNVTSWLPPGLQVDVGKTRVEPSGGKIVVTGCQRVSSVVEVWITYQS